MTSTTVPDFNGKTEASTVASTFPASVKGRTIVITGVNKLGLGYATALALASQAPLKLVLCGRSEAKLQECAKGIHSEYPNVEIRPLIVDLSSQKAVRKAASEILEWEDTPKIDIIINNAGVMNIPERTLSEDGIEMHLATNHLGHFLFTNLLMPKVLAAAKDAQPGSTRIINLSSMGIMTSGFRLSDPNFEKPGSELPESEQPNYPIFKHFGLDGDESTIYIPLAAYGQAKSAALLFSVALNERLYEKYHVLSLALHPGEIYTELHRTTSKEWLAKVDEARKTPEMALKTPEQGSSTTLVAALDPKLGKPNDDGYGQFLSDCQISRMPPPSRLDKNIAAKLWDMSEGWVEEKFVW
ncbi:NAD(P)-binding protein [Lophiostoma macrostomum CBS 122681]|uniref:NAD(P)-binding protein n=1 Tax=Lophiostoma macrostomum CBS 122681 TaxID=1314788 RepID=A0A6A6T634_9PLEO|nr:NAD(P)-binding protein [Lophiostoma macrostomum CBS 122681]